MNNSTITININGMTCGHCSRYVRQVIDELEGIIQTDVSLENGTATVIYDTQTISSDAIVAALRDTHYTVVGIQ